MTDIFPAARPLPWNTLGLSTVSLVASAILVVSSGSAFGAESARVTGTNVTYPVVSQVSSGKKSTDVKLTGAALRKKFFVQVYTIGSYVDSKAETVTEPSKLIEADVAKQLHMVLLRSVSGKDISDQLVERVLANHPRDKFKEELKAMHEYFVKSDVKKGTSIKLTHVPTVGLRCEVSGGSVIEIQNVDFARAIWEIYFGENCVSEDIRSNLLTRIAQNGGGRVR